ncbi:hypothetical protein GCM10022286_05630 [Gryllotalpicola daejeonensis]|uniref:Uncharacterized protein n=1 Tax=Gryllotalpicola daejeonensis TaxID=993087 RepID=A0ABP7ZF63_9MICO
MPARKFTTAVNRFKRSAKGRLSDADAPAVATLEVLASELDSGNLTPALIAQYGLTYRSLLKRVTADEPPAESELTALLRDAQA